MTLGRKPSSEVAWVIGHRVLMRPVTIGRSLSIEVQEASSDGGGTTSSFFWWSPAA